MLPASDWDRQQILSLDPFLDLRSLDGTRFSKVGQYVIAGPDAAGEHTNPIAINVGDQDQTSSTQTSTTTASFGFAAGGGFSFFVATSLKAGVDFNSDWQNSTAKSTTTSNTSAVTLTTSTVKYADTVDVYVDHLFKSFAYVSHKTPDGIIKTIYNVPGDAPVPVQSWPVVVQKVGAGT